jgi:hypothetical protein
MDLIGLINQNITAFDAGIIYLIVSSAVQSLPEPSGSTKWYVWLYRFAHAIVANWKPATKKLKDPK